LTGKKNEKKGNTKKGNENRERERERERELSSYGFFLGFHSLKREGDEVFSEEAEGIHSQQE